MAGPFVECSGSGEVNLDTFPVEVGVADSLTGAAIILVAEPFADDHCFGEVFLDTLAFPICQAEVETSVMMTEVTSALREYD
jgi:hypothetical protein